MGRTYKSTKEILKEFRSFKIEFEDSGIPVRISRHEARELLEQYDRFGELPKLELTPSGREGTVCSISSKRVKEKDS